MTDEQIIKAFEEMAEDNRMPIIDQCICSDVLDLINRQAAEIGRLKRKNVILSRNADTAFQDGLDENRELFKKEVEAEIKSEAIKEFAERLKEINSTMDKRIIPVERIDDLVREMTEGV